MKGGKGKFASDKCLEFIEDTMGRTSKIIVKSDQENSIDYVVNDDEGQIIFSGIFSGEQR